MKSITRYAIAGLSLVALAVAGCQTTTPKTEIDREALQSNSQTAMKTLSQSDATLQPFIDTAYGYAIFPSVGKGAVVVGGAEGQGAVYEQGKFIGYSRLAQASIGLQLGGQSFTEVIAFQDEAAMRRFKQERFEFTAGVSAVALKAGAAASAKYTDGVAVFVKPNAGAMFEASVGGQKFTYQPDGSIYPKSDDMDHKGNQ